MGETKRRDVSTGIDQLDEDLRSLFDFCNADRLADLHKALEDKEVSTDDLADMIPEGVLSLVLACQPGQYDELWETVQEGARPTLQEAKQLVAEHLTVLLEHPKAKLLLTRAVRSALEKAKRTKAHPLEKSFNVVTGVASITLYLGTPPELRPSQRVAFTSSDGRLLLDTVMDWDDMTYVVGNLIHTLAERMDEAKVLQEKGQLEEIPEKIKGKLARRFTEIQTHLRTIVQLAPFYGIELEEMADAPSEESVQPSPPEEEKAT